MTAAAGVARISPVREGDAGNRIAPEKRCPAAHSTAAAERPATTPVFHSKGADVELKPNYAALPEPWKK